MVQKTYQNWLFISWCSRWCCCCSVRDKVFRRSQQWYKEVKKFSLEKIFSLVYFSPNIDFHSAQLFTSAEIINAFPFLKISFSFVFATLFHHANVFYLQFIVYIENPLIFRQSFTILTQKCFGFNAKLNKKISISLRSTRSWRTRRRRRILECFPRSEKWISENQMHLILRNCCWLHYFQRSEGNPLEGNKIKLYIFRWRAGKSEENSDEKLCLNGKSKTHMKLNKTFQFAFFSYLGTRCFSFTAFQLLSLQLPQLVFARYEKY